MKELSQQKKMSHLTYKVTELSLQSEAIRSIKITGLNSPAIWIMTYMKHKEGWMLMSKKKRIYRN